MITPIYPVPDDPPAEYTPDSLAYFFGDTQSFLEPFKRKKGPANSCAVPNPPIPCANACPPVPPHPGYASVNANMNAAAAAPFALYSFYNLVRNHGPWDYKQAKNLNDFGGIVAQSPFEDFGNFNYGAAAASLGVPLSVALRMAGYAGVKSATGSTWDATKASLGPPPYGDDPPDQVMINQGYAFSQQGCHE